MSEPFQITRWEAPKAPTIEFVTRMLAREGLTPDRQEWAPGTHTPEIKHERPGIMVLISGEVQVAFPGYGVRDLGPGDILELEAGILYDITVTSREAAVLLQTFKGAS